MQEQKRPAKGRLRLSPWNPINQGFRTLNHDQRAFAPFGNLTSISVLDDEQEPFLHPA
jgi:hypothetical protein